MSRTVLIDLLRRAYHRAYLSATDGLAIAPKQAQHPILSRRQVLGGLAMATGLGLKPRIYPRRKAIAPSTAAVESRSESPVLIVGAGMAGLVAAYRLQQAGVAVAVIEASPRVGGRLQSVTQAGSVVELGGEFIDSRHQAVRAIAAELGLELADLRAADVGLTPEILYFQGQRISHDQVVAEFTPLAQRISQDLDSLRGQSINYRSASPAAQRLDRLSLAEYLDGADISPVINQLVRIAYVTEYGCDAEMQSCLNMLFLIGSDVGKWSTYGVSDERYHTVGGNDQIPTRLAQRLEGVIELNTALESIRARADGRYQVSVRQGATSRDRVYDQVLITIPFSVLRHVELNVALPPVKQRAIAQLGYGTCSKLAIPFQERIWRTRYGSTISVYTDQAFQNTWESARYLAGPGGWVTDLRGGAAGVALGNDSPDLQADQLTQALDPLFPGIAQVPRGTALRAVWPANPYARGSYSCYLPGQRTQFGGSEIERVGNLWFAGEHCSAESQGYMNGACETAERAVRGILAERSILAERGIRRSV